MDHPLDPDTLLALREIMQSEFDALLNAYLLDGRLKLQQMRRALTLGDRDALRQAAHSLKGSSLNLGALAMGDFCLKLELAAPDAQAAELGSLLAHGEALFQDAETQIREELGGDA